MKAKKRMLAGLIIIMISFSMAACSKEEKDASEGVSEQITEETETAGETDEAETVEEAETTEETEATEAGSSPEQDTDRETEEASGEAATEFAIPVQENFTPVEGLSGNYADLENRSFAYNGKLFTLGTSTLQDLIDGGIPFEENDLNNKGNNVNKNYETSTYTARINDYVTMQFRFINTTGDSMTEAECPLSYARIYYLYVPQPDYDAEMNAEIAENILDAANTVCFSFPVTLTKEQLLENNSEYTELGERNYVNYYIDSEIYMGSSGYHFKFNATTNQLEEMSISWLP